MNNDEALGYATIALYEVLKNRGTMKFEEIKELIIDVRNEMYFTFDMKTEYEAQAIGEIIKYADSEKELKNGIDKYMKKLPKRTIVAIPVQIDPENKPDKSLRDIVNEGKKQGMSAYDSLNKAGFIKDPSEFDI